MDPTSSNSSIPGINIDSGKSTTLRDKDTTPPNPMPFVMAATSLTNIILKSTTYDISSTHAQALYPISPRISHLATNVSRLDANITTQQFVSPKAHPPPTLGGKPTVPQLLYSGTTHSLIKSALDLLDNEMELDHSSLIPAQDSTCTFSPSK